MYCIYKRLLGLTDFPIYLRAEGILRLIILMLYLDCLLNTLERNGAGEEQVFIYIQNLLNYVSY